MISIRGYSSQIVKSFLDLLPPHEQISVLSRGGLSTKGERHLFCQGFLQPRSITVQTNEEIAKSFLVNAADIIKQCELIFASNDEARVCIIGSESGFSGSFDASYAASKAALHSYVETKKLRTSSQQIVCIAPSIISDAGMTIRRNDLDNLKRKEASHPKGRFLYCSEVAKLIHFLLYVDEGYLCNIVIRMNGGQHVR